MFTKQNLLAYTFVAIAALVAALSLFTANTSVHYVSVLHVAMSLYLAAGVSYFVSTVFKAYAVKYSAMMLFAANVASSIFVLINI